MVVLPMKDPSECQNLQNRRGRAMLTAEDRQTLTNLVLHGHSTKAMTQYHISIGCLLSVNF
jgi:hypothetical protein